MTAIWHRTISLSQSVRQLDSLSLLGVVILIAGFAVSFVPTPQMEETKLISAVTPKAAHNPVAAVIAKELPWL